jgi:hypothetical protein
MSHNITAGEHIRFPAVLSQQIVFSRTPIGMTPRTAQIQSESQHVA